MMSFLESSSTCPPYRLKYVLNDNSNLREIQSAYGETPQAWTLDLCKSFLVCQNRPPQPGVLKFLFDKLPPPDLETWCQFHKILKWRNAGTIPFETELTDVMKIVFDTFDNQCTAWKTQEDFKATMDNAIHEFLTSLLLPGRYTRYFICAMCVHLAERFDKFRLLNNRVTLDDVRRAGIFVFLENPRITTISVRATWQSTTMISFLEDNDVVVRAIANLPSTPNCAIRTFLVSFHDEEAELFSSYISLAYKMPCLTRLEIGMPDRLWAHVVPLVLAVMNNSDISMITILSEHLDQPGWHELLALCSHTLENREKLTQVRLRASHRDAHQFSFPVDEAVSVMEQNDLTENLFSNQTRLWCMEKA